MERYSMFMSEKNNIIKIFTVYKDGINRFSAIPVKMPMEFST